jgi:hypothetical protein
VWRSRSQFGPGGASRLLQEHLQLAYLVTPVASPGNRRQLVPETAAQQRLSTTVSFFFFYKFLITQTGGHRWMLPICTYFRGLYTKCARNLSAGTEAALQNSAKLRSASVVLAKRAILVMAQGHQLERGAWGREPAKRRTFVVLLPPPRESRELAGLPRQLRDLTWTASTRLCWTVREGRQRGAFDGALLLLTP